MGQTIDFSSYSKIDLTNAANSINRDKHPENYSACIKEIQARKERGLWVEPKETEFDFTKLRKPLAIGSIILGSIYSVLNAYNLYLYLGMGAWIVALIGLLLFGITFSLLIGGIFIIKGRASGNTLLKVGFGAQILEIFLGGVSCKL